MNKFGGSWTELKIEMLVEYASAYLTIMNKYARQNGWKLLYFDGFAGSGEIEKGKKEYKKKIIGAAKRIIDINEPISFDEYYFVEKDYNNLSKLKGLVSDNNKKVHFVNEDCNLKIKSMGDFLSKEKGRKYKVLAYLDPYGMQLNFSSLMALKEAKIDAWILVPTGIGVNRLLKQDGQISESWKMRLSDFLGMEPDQVLSFFYTETKTMTLFGEEETKFNKEEKAINKAASLYKSRLKEIFEFVSEPFSLRNQSNSTMFHFIMVSNNKTAVNIANSIIKKFTFKK